MIAKLDDGADLAARIDHHVPVKLAISPARGPAFADSKTITRFRSGWRVHSANVRRSATSTGERILACFPSMSSI
jgi:hypothetical protein